MSALYEDKETEVYFGMLLSIEKGAEMNQAEFVPYDKIHNIDINDDIILVTYEPNSKIRLQTAFEPRNDISLITLHHELKNGSYIDSEEYYYRSALKETLIDHYSGECLETETTLEERIGQAPPPLPRE